MCNAYVNLAHDMGLGLSEAESTGGIGMMAEYDCGKSAAEFPRVETRGSTSVQASPYKDFRTRISVQANLLKGMPWKVLVRISVQGISIFIWSEFRARF